MAFTISPNCQQNVIAQAVAPGITVQLEEYLLEPSDGLEVYNYSSEHTLSLALPDSCRPPCWTRFEGDRQYLRQRDLQYDPPEVGRHTYASKPPPASRWTSCYFDPLIFEERTGLTGEWENDRLQACHTIDGPMMLEAMRQLSRELTAPGFASTIAIESLANLMMVEIARHFQSRAAIEPPSTGRLSQRNVKRIEEYLRDNSGRGLTIQHLANLCGLNADHLRRTFRCTTGQSLGSYVEQVKISKAKAMLAERNMTIKQIAYQLGFAAPSGFCVAFRRATGETPKTYQLRSYQQ